MSTLEAALSAVLMGWKVFPCVPGGKRPGVKSDWERRACGDSEIIRQHWPTRANVGLACGPSGLVVIDCDVPKSGETPPPEWAEPGVSGGLDALALLCERHGQRLPAETFQVQTPSGGWHWYFSAPEGTEVRNSASKVAWKVDVRAAGGYVVGAGSVTLAGAYEVVHEAPLAPLPGWLLPLLLPQRQEQAPSRPLRAVSAPQRRERRGGGSEEAKQEAYKFAAMRNALERLLETGEGGRNDALNREAWGLVKAGWAPTEVGPILLDAGQRIGLPEAEARRTLASALGIAA